MVPHLPCGSFFTAMFVCACVCVYSIEILKADWLTGLSYGLGIIFFVLWIGSMLLKYFWYIVFGLMFIGLIVSHFK